MRSILATTIVGVALVGLAVAAPPGPMDGENIPADYAQSTELGAQTNPTGFGNQVLGTGAFAPGSELDAMYLAISSNGAYLMVGLTGNLERNGHAFVIFIDQVGLFDGQTELRAEAVGGPPYAVQTASREVFVFVGTDGLPDTADDTWDYGTNGLSTGTILPCMADYALAVDVFGGTMSVSQYILNDPAGTSGVMDPTPNNPNDPNLILHATRQFVAQGPADDNNDVFESFVDFGFAFGGFNDTNTAGITDTSGLGAATAVKGMEIGIPMAVVGFGLIPAFDTINVFVAVLDGGGSMGTVVNQVLPPISSSGAAPCNPPAPIGLRPDLTLLTSCIQVVLADLPTYSGIAEGLIDPFEYGTSGLALASQTCPTPYGDQQWDPNAQTISGGSEIDVIWADNDDQFLYLGITGNIEGNGNSLNIFIDVDNDSSTGGLGMHILDWGTSGPLFGSVGGMEGDELANGQLPGDEPIKYDYAYRLNTGGGANIWVNFYDLLNVTETWYGSSVLGSGDPTVSNGDANPNGFMAGGNNLNEDGVEGCGCPDATTCGALTAAEVEAQARSATLGFEIGIPLADLGIAIPLSAQQTINIWAHVTGDSGWGADQSLPSMRNVSKDGSQVFNGEGGPTNYNDPFNTNGCRDYEARAATYTLLPSPKIASAESCRLHGATEHCLPMNSGVEPRAGGVRKLVFQMDKPMEASTVNAGNVTVTCAQQYNGVITASLVGTNGVVVGFGTDGLPDQDCCRIDLSGMEATDGTVAQMGWNVQILTGDVNLDQVVSSSDAGSVKSRLGATTGPGNFQFDVNLDGGISAGDFGSVKARLGRVVPNCEDIVQPGEDCFSTSCAVSQYDFCATPIPADFFGPGSQPFEGIVAFGGGAGVADTVVRRLDTMVLAGASPVQTPIELVELDLISCQPIEVVGVGSSGLTNWDVEISLSSTPAPLGTMTVTKTHDNGGVFSSEFFVQPVFTFTEVGNPSNVRVFDTGIEGIPPVQLVSITQEPWVHHVDPATGAVVCDPNFAPGVEEDISTQGQCCRPIGHSAGPGFPPGHIHEVGPPECGLCPGGACCITTNGSCVEVPDELACTGLGGEYKGDSTDCSDSDADGIPDWFETSQCDDCTTPPPVDLCNIGTDPLNPDTDGDGCSDGDEVYIFATNPCDPGDCTP